MTRKRLTTHGSRLTQHLRLAAVLVGVFAFTAVAAAQNVTVRDQIGQPRAAGPMPAGTGAISGVVTTDEATPQPVRRATVTITGDNGFAKSTLTDDRGQFVIDALPAVRVTLAATKAGFVRAAYGAKRYDRPGTPITLADGQRMNNLTLKLARGSVITGTIVDDTGLPAVNVSVRAMQYRVQPGGERALVPATSASALNEQTDDRGIYRLFGLPAGEYVIVASPRLPEGGDARAMTDTEIRAAMAAAQQPPALSGRGAGSPAPGTAAANSGNDAVMVGYSPVYYPGATLAARAGTITVGTGEERSGADFALSMVRTAKIEGTVIAPAGIPPQGVQLLMVNNAGGMTGAEPMGTTRVGPDGKFTYTGIAPGQYTITARTGGRSTVMTFGPGGGSAQTMMIATATLDGPGRGGAGANANAGAAGEPPPQLWGLAEVSVDGQNVSNVTISLQPGMTLSGRLAFDAVKMTAPADLSRARITLLPAGSASGITMSTGAAQVDAAGRFTITGLTPGKYRFNAAVPSDGALGSWSVKSAVAGGRDALDLPLELAPGEAITNAVVTFTDATQEVSGHLQDASGRPAPDFTMVVFPADRRLWQAQSRRIKAVRPDTGGRFVVTGLPQGDYRIAAVLDIAPNDVNDVSLLEQLVGASVPFTLTAGEKHVQDFKIGG